MDAIEATYGPGSPGDPALTRQARLQQAWYRVHTLQILECGSSPDSGGPLQSYLPVGLERANFISDEAYRYALERLQDKAIERDLTIAADRLKYNMLSSQPMCFNLFADIRAAVAHDDQGATQVVAAMFPEVSFNHVDSVIVEEVPSPPPDYIHDKTGWDASIRYNGGLGLLTIETKYTDKIDTGRPRRDNPHILDVARKLGVFNKQGLEYYEHLGGVDQLGRNVLLTVAYATRNTIDVATNYVLAPRFDTQASTLVDGMRTRLASEHQEAIQFRTLDDAVDRGVGVATGPIANSLCEFRTRYLDLSPAEALLASA